MLFSAPKYVEPPIEFKDTPIKIAIETVFLKTGVCYSIEVQDLTTYGTVSLIINEKIELDKFLTLILEIKNLTFAVDEKGVYHIKKKVKEQKKRISIDFPNTPIRKALEEVFKMADVVFVIEVPGIESYGNITLVFSEPQELDTILYCILDPRTLTFTVDSNGKYRIKKKSEKSKLPLKYVEPPIDFQNTPVKIAIETVFLKAGVQYSIEIADLTAFGNVTLAITERQELDTMLALILEPKNLQFIVDASGIYHVMKKEKDNSAPPRVTKLYAITDATAGGAFIGDEKDLQAYYQKKDGGLDEYYVLPPLDLKNTPIKTALEVVFAKAGLQDIKFLGDPDVNVTVSIKEKTPLNVLIIEILKDANVKIENKSGIFYLTQIKKK